MKRPKRNKPATIVRMTITLTMSDGRQLVVYDVGLDVMLIHAQLFATTPKRV